MAQGIPAQPRGGNDVSPGLFFAAAAFSAAATVAAFPPLGAWPAALVMFAPLVAALDRASPRTAFWMTYGYQVATALAIVRWLVVPLAADYGIPDWRAWTFVVGLVSAYALIHALAASLWVRARPGHGEFMAPLGFAAVWTLSESLRAGPLVLPWMLTGQAVVASPVFVQVADLGGTAAVSFTVLAISAGLGIAISRASWRPLVLPALLTACTLGYGAYQLAGTEDPEPSLDVGIVQAAVAPRDRFIDGSAHRNLKLHLVASRALLDEGPLDLIVWAETSIDAYLEPGSEVMIALQRFVDRMDVALVTGAARDHGDGVFTNSILLFVPGGSEPESYDKQRLVPFAEYDPQFGSLLNPLIGELSRADGQFEAGSEAVVFETGPIRFSAPVCFEITYPNEVRRFRERGADLMLNLSNDAWFGRTGFAELHLGQAQLRAVELRSWLVRGANTGISAIIDPQGRLQGSLGVYAEGTLRGSVGSAGPPPFFARFGSGPFVGVLIAGLIVAGSSSRTRD
jgi:apolipoprotein N-acyltransferase